jgi:hypothetical protein
MVGDAEARDAVRQIVKRLELIAAQGGALAYVLAKRDPQEYARLLEALDDPRADWSKAVMAMLNRGGIELTGKRAIEGIKFVQGLEGRFDAEMKNRNKSDEEPGIGKRG